MSDNGPETYPESPDHLHQEPNQTEPEQKHEKNHHHNDHHADESSGTAYIAQNETREPTDNNSSLNQTGQEEVKTYEEVEIKKERNHVEQEENEKTEQKYPTFEEENQPSNENKEQKYPAFEEEKHVQREKTEQKYPTFEEERQDEPKVEENKQAYVHKTEDNLFLKEKSSEKEGKKSEDGSKGEDIQGEVLKPNEDENDDIEDDMDQDEYGDMDRLDIPKYEKEKGKECISKGEYEEATKHYSKAILAVNFLFKDHKVPTEDKAVELLKEIQIPCYLNLSLCYIKLKSWRMALENASTALTLDEDNVKALYRKALAAFNLGELETTQSCLKKALELEPNDREINNLARDLIEKKKQIQKKEKKIGEKMLTELSKAREEEQDQIKFPKKKSETGAQKPENKSLKDKALHELAAKKEEVTNQVKTWRDQLKLLILLPLNLFSEICCRRRLPSQFYQPESLKKKE